MKTTNAALAISYALKKHGPTPFTIADLLPEGFDIDDASQVNLSGVSPLTNPDGSKYDLSKVQIEITKNYNGTGRTLLRLYVYLLTGIVKVRKIIYTGPAATVLGLSALGVIGNQHTVALDIGGTTTDISLWKHGRPLMTKNGVSIREYPSAVRSFAVTSVGIGGESVVRIVNGEITVGPERVGPSAALGGNEPTLGDALIVLGNASYGKVGLAEQAMEVLANRLNASTNGDTAQTHQQLAGGVTASDVAQSIVNKALQTIQHGIDEVVQAENKRPVYVVADIVNPDVFVPTQIVVVGGTAPSLGPSIGEFLNLPVTIPDNAAVANAIGAALALSTIELTVHVDTKRRLLVIPELGIKQQTCTLKRVEQVVERAKEALIEEALRLGLDKTQEVEVISIEDFPVVEGWQSMERLITVKVQLEAGVKYYVE